MVATKTSVMQFRIDASLKREAEDLFHELGTSFSEALRIFAKQCVLTHSMPITVALPRTNSAAGLLSEYADSEKRKKEEGAFARAMEEKPANAR